MRIIDPSKFKSLKTHRDQPWVTFDPEEYMSRKSLQAASQSFCKSNSQWAETHAFRVGKTPDGNTVFVMVLINPHGGACWAGVICPEDKFDEMSATVFSNAQTKGVLFAPGNTDVTGDVEKSRAAGRQATTNVNSSGGNNERTV